MTDDIDLNLSIQFQIIHDDIPDTEVETDTYFSNKNWYPTLKKSKYFTADKEYPKLCEFLKDAYRRSKWIYWKEIDREDVNHYFKMKLMSLHFKKSKCAHCGVIYGYINFSSILSEKNGETCDIDIGIVKTYERYCECVLSYEDPDINRFETLKDPLFLFEMFPKTGTSKYAYYTAYLGVTEFTLEKLY
jgi:hypothetical protein